MMRDRTKIYTILQTSLDADYGDFPEPDALCSFLSRERAKEELARLVEERKRELKPLRNTIKEEDGVWEAYEDGNWTANYIRLEILTTELVDGSAVTDSAERMGGEN